MSLDATVALCTLDEAKAFLKIPTTSNSDDAQVELIVNGAWASAESYTGRRFVSTARTEYYDGDGTDTLCLAQYPITAVSSLNIDNNRSFASLTDIDVSTSLQIAKESGIITLWNYASTFTAGIGNVKIVYTAGYTSATCPWDLKLAVLKLASRDYANAYQSRRVGLDSENIGDKSLTISKDGIPSDVKSVFDRYRAFPTTGRVFA